MAVSKSTQMQNPSGKQVMLTPTKNTPNFSFLSSLMCVIFVFVEQKALVLDFKGRVTKSSIKNFQLVQEKDQDNPNSQFVLQFGKRHDGSYILDLKFPMSIF